MHLLVYRSGGTDAVTRSLEEFLSKQGYVVIVADNVQQAVAAAQRKKPHLAFIPTRVDQASDTLMLMQKLSLLGIPAVMINGQDVRYSAADDKALARALSRLARHRSENGNGHHH